MSRFRFSVAAVAVTVFLASALACSSDKKDSKNPVSPEPTGLALSVGHESIWVGQETGIEASLVFPDKSEDPPVCRWYVNDELGGNEDLGTITQNNPAVYTAPLTPPPGQEVTIRAVWDENESIEGSASVVVLVPQVVLRMPRNRIQVEETLSVLAVLEEAGPLKRRLREDAGEFEWSVGDSLGGNAELGTITQGNPAIYTAPSVVPVGLGVQIKAVWTGAPGYDASGNVAILNTIMHVNAGSGEDEPGRGRLNSPYRTISFALSQVEHGRSDTILVAPGVYDLALGEQSGSAIKWDTTLRGVDRDLCIIDADPSPDAPSTTVFYMTSNGVIENFTFRNTDPDSRMQYAIQIQSDATVRNVRITDPYRSAAIRIMNPMDQALVEDCEFVNTGNPGEHTGMWLTGPAVAMIRNTTVRGWREGIHIDSPMPHRIEGCTISGNARGVLINEADANPDLGGGAAGSQGNNVIQGNAIGIYNGSVNDIFAKHNTWGSSPPTVCQDEADAPCDFYNHGAGSVIWE